MSKYCSLKEAFKSPNFFKNEEEIIIPKSDPHFIPYTVQNNNIEKFENDIKDINDCDYIKKHLTTCKKCYSSTDIAFNDILNMLLIVLLIWIIIYKPHI